MQTTTRKLWADQNRHDGDRMRLFTAVRAEVGGKTVLYPGSFVDVAPSVVFPSVTYVDTDRRTPGFFADRDGIIEIVTSSGGPANADYQFIHADYQEPLDLPARSFDLLVSLYSGFVSEHCTDYLKIGGGLLVAPSHGDVAMASIDSRYELSSVVVSRNGDYRVRTESLETYLEPKSPVEITPAMLHERGRGIAYTKSPFAYLFTRAR
jgi:hypothetical protein